MILQSKSWKLTSPLRRIYDFIDAAKQGLTVNRATQYSENGHSTTQGGAAVGNVVNVDLQETNETEWSELPGALPASLIDNYLTVKLKLFLSHSTTSIVFPRFEQPLVSIIIPTFNKAEYLYQCFRATLHTQMWRLR